MRKPIPALALAVGLLLAIAAAITGTRALEAAAGRSHHLSGRGAHAANLADQNAPYDEQFIDQMVLHHEMAIMSVQMMIANSPHPELQDLARRIEQVQQQQIDAMRAWRDQWYGGGDASTLGGMSMNQMMQMMMDGCGTPGGMRQMMGGMMGGSNQDDMFLRMMIPHHQAAIDMSRDALQQANHDEIKTLAQQIIDGQSAEIVEMNGYLMTWFGETAPACSAAS